MAMFQTFDMRAEQRLKMTPQLQQAIHLLQLSNLELTEYLKDESERNPFLEVHDFHSDVGQGDLQINLSKRENERDGSPQEMSTPNPYDSEKSSLDTAILPSVDTPYQEGIPQSVQMDTGTSETSYENTYDTDYGSDTAFQASDYESHSWDNVKSIDSQFGEDDRGFQISQGTSLHDHLTKQLMMTAIPHKQRLICHVLIACVEGSGYLSDPLADIAMRLNLPLQEVEEALEVCQTFEPVGVFSRSLKECLTLQLKDQSKLTPLMEQILDHLELVGKRDYPALMRLTKTTKETLQETLGDLRRLNPKPASDYDCPVAQTLIPDVIIRRDALTHGWSVELNNQTLPRVIVNKEYGEKLQNNATSNKETNAFIHQNLQSAEWLKSIVNRRSSTILKVATEIVRQQDGFFEYGISHLRPMNLKAIAEVLEMHESTISRVTSNKYIRCPRGTFEMKFFFMSGISHSDGENNVASESVKFRIKALIDKEKPHNILSDEDLVMLLGQEEIKIARRTVAKYREALGIASSIDRKRQKRVL
jgi:RNA polymerase sigma-54 factor